MTRPEVILPPAPDYALRIRHTVAGPRWEQWYFIMGDVHWDSPECYLGLLHKHLREAKDRNALIIDLGDFFDIISSQGDARATKDTYRPRHKSDSYLDAVIKDAIHEFKPYLNSLIYMGAGNHESKIRRLKEIDITARFIESAQRYRGDLPPIHRAGYHGWIRFMFAQNNQRQSFNAKIEHGQGASSPVTKGAGMSARRQARTEGATFFFSGHIHEQTSVPIIMERLNENTSQVEYRKTEHIQVGSYKQDHRSDGRDTWFMKASGTPKPIGGAFLRFHDVSHGTSPGGGGRRTIEWQIDRPWVDYAKLSEYLPKD